MHEFFIKKNQNAPRPSEPSQGGKMSKRLGGIKGCKYKNIFMAFSYIITIIILGSHNFGLSSERHANTQHQHSSVYLSPLLISLRSIQNCQR